MITLDQLNLERQVKILEEKGFSGLHIDLLDGYFSPSLPLGLDTVRQLRRKTNLSFDCHVMAVFNDFFINELIDIGVQQITFHIETEKHQFILPPFLHFTPEEWQDKDHSYDEIRDNCLGWDITDYGEGNFAEKGLTLITLRNGNYHNAKYSKPYAEKIMLLKEGQISPNHFHWLKMEDIINRDGGLLAFMAQNPNIMGEKAIEAAVQLVNGETLAETEIDTGVSVVTKDNVADFED